MWRIIIILVLLIILYFMIRKGVRDYLGHTQKPADLPAKDVMVQDPVCKLYISAGSAIIEKIGGQYYHFCSDECAEKFKNYMKG